MLAAPFHDRDPTGIEPERRRVRLRDAVRHRVETLGEMPAGDFVRWARQVVDLLGQLADSGGASAELRSTARQAIAAVNRGVLSYQATA